MKKLIVLAIVIGLLAGAMVMPADAKKKKKPAPAPAEPVRIERVVDFDYTCVGPCVGLFQLGGLTGENIGGGPIPTGTDDLFIKAEATDMSGQPVVIEIQQDLDGDGGNNPVGTLCGRADEKAISINAGLEIRVFISSGTCEDGTPALALGGDIKFTLSNMP